MNEDYYYEECATCAYRGGDDPVDICSMCDDADQWEEDLSSWADRRTIPIVAAA